MVRMESLIWPGTVTIISVAFFLIFKRPLGDLLDRTKGISRDGLQVGDRAPNTLPPKAQESAAEMEARMASAKAQEISDIRTELSETQKSLAEIKTELLRFQKNIGYRRGELR